MVVYGSVTGSQDAFLTDKPNFSYFNDEIQYEFPSYSETYVIPFDTEAATVATIPTRGDFIKDITLRMAVPGLVNVNDDKWYFLDTPPSGYMRIFNKTRQANSIIEITPANFSVNQVNFFNSIIPGIQKIGSGPDFSLIVSSGKMYVAGNNSYGQLGTGYTDNVTALTQLSVAPLFSFPPQYISCGKYHTVVLDSNGIIWGSGDSTRGQIGSYAVPPVLQFRPLSTATVNKIACNSYSTWILVGDILYATGNSVTGELGEGNPMNPTYPTYSYFTSKTNGVTGVYCGPDFTFYTTSTQLLAAGNNNKQQLGIGTAVTPSKFFTQCYFNGTPVFPILSFVTGDSYAAFMDTSYQIFVSGFGLSSSFSLISPGFTPTSLYGISNEIIVKGVNSMIIKNATTNNIITVSSFSGTPSIFKTFFVYDKNIYGNISNGIIGTGMGGYSTTGTVIELPKIVKNYITFNFPYDTSKMFLVFDNIECANFFGYDYKDLSRLVNNIFYTSVTTSTLTLRQSGFIQGYDKAVSANYVYPPWYDILNSVSLYIGKQHIQTLPSEFLKFKQDVSTSYKNRPCLDMVNGDGKNVVPEYRIFLINTGLLEYIPINAISLQDVQFKLNYNKVSNAVFSLIISFTHFNSLKNTDYTIAVPQVQSIPKGPCTKIFFTDTFQSLSFNGEKMFDSDYSNVSSIDTLTNIPKTGTTVVFNGPINLSRIRDVDVTAPTSNVYYECINFLKVSGGIAGLLFS
jgi:hypothetical protein